VKKLLFLLAINLALFTSIMVSILVLKDENRRFFNPSKGQDFPNKESESDNQSSTKPIFFLPAALVRLVL
jgi:hypothetical protein